MRELDISYSTYVHKHSLKRELVKKSMKRNGVIVLTILSIILLGFQAVRNYRENKYNDMFTALISIITLFIAGIKSW